MPPTHIIIDHNNSAHGSSRHSSSSISTESNGTGVRLSSPPSVSAGSTPLTGSDRSGSNDYVHVPLEPLLYPDEVHPEDSASRLPPRQQERRRHHTAEVAARRPHTYRHESRHRVAHHPHDELEYIHTLGHHPGSPESVESEDYERGYGRPGMAVHRPAYAYGVQQYPPGAAEPFAQYPPVPSTQMIQAVPPPQSYNSYGHYQQATPNAVAAPHVHASHASHGAGFYQSSGALGQVSYPSPYSQPGAMPGAMAGAMPYGPAGAGYFPPAPYPLAQYALPHPSFYPYPPRGRSPSPVKKAATPPPAPAPAPAAPPAPTPKESAEETLKMMKELFELQQKQIEERDKAKEAAKEAELKKIEEARKAAEERAAADKALQDAATASAKAEAAKQLAEANEKAEKALNEAKEAAEKALKEAKEAAAKEQADAVAAAKAAPPPEKKAPIKFKDAIGRKYQFPWDMCCKWNNMEELIRQAFTHVENLAQHVYEGHYDLAGPSGEIILKDCWEATIEPDWTIVMHMWPLPEPEPPKIEEDLIPGLAEMMITVDDKNKKKGKKGAKIPAVVVDKKKRAAAADVHGPIPVPPPVPVPPMHMDDGLYGEIPLVEVVPDPKPKKTGKRQSGLFWIGGARPGPSKPKKKQT